VGLCPLHLETRPSFYVNARKNLFYCHGCGRGGDLIRFVELLFSVCEKSPLRSRAVGTRPWAWSGRGSSSRSSDMVKKVRLRPLYTFGIQIGPETYCRPELAPDSLPFHISTSRVAQGWRSQYMRTRAGMVTPLDLTP